MALTKDKKRGEQHYILTVRFNVERSPLEKQTVKYLLEQSEGIEPVNGLGDPIRIILNQMVQVMMGHTVTPSHNPVDILRNEMNLRMGELQTIMENVGIEILSEMGNLSVGVMPMGTISEPVEKSNPEVSDDFMDSLVNDHWDDE